MKHRDKSRPPRLPLAFFRWFCCPDFQEEIEGDLLEQFYLNTERFGADQARWLFTMDVLRLFRLGIIFNLSTFAAMKKSDWLRLLALSLLFALFVILPFLPGPSNNLSIGLSAVGQMSGFFGVLMIPLSATWAFFEFRKLLQRAGGKANNWNNGFYFAIAATLVGIFAYTVTTAGLTHEDGRWVTAVSAPVGLFLLWKTVQGIRKLRRQTTLKFNPAPLYLITIPVMAMLTKFMFEDSMAAISRDKAIHQSELLISAIENYHSKEGRYPETLADLQPVYLSDIPQPRVMGVKKFIYEKTADAYRLSFWQHLGATEELVVYNKNNQYNVKGHYASGEAGAAHWRYFWLD